MIVGADKRRAGLAHPSGRNWLAVENKRRTPCPAETGARGAVPERRRAARALDRDGKFGGRSPCPAVEGDWAAEERRGQKRSAFRPLTPIAEEGPGGGAAAALDAVADAKK